MKIEARNKVRAEIQAKGGKAAGWSGNQETFIFSGRPARFMEDFCSELKKNEAVMGAFIGLRNGDLSISIKWK